MLNFGGVTTWLHLTIPNLHTLLDARWPIGPSETVMIHEFAIAILKWVCPRPQILARLQRQRNNLGRQRSHHYTLEIWQWYLLASWLQPFHTKYQQTSPFIQFNEVNYPTNHQQTIESPHPYRLRCHDYRPIRLWHGNSTIDTGHIGMGTSAQPFVMPEVNSQKLQVAMICGGKKCNAPAKIVDVIMHFSAKVIWLRRRFVHAFGTFHERLGGTVLKHTSIIISIWPAKEKFKIRYRYHRLLIWEKDTKKNNMMLKGNILQQLTLGLLKFPGCTNHSGKCGFSSTGPKISRIREIWRRVGKFGTQNPVAATVNNLFVLFEASKSQPVM